MPQDTAANAPIPIEQDDGERAQRPPNPQVVVSRRVGAEWIEEIVELCQQVLQDYGRKVGEDYIVLAKP